MSTEFDVLKPDFDWLSLMQGLTVAHCESRGIQLAGQPVEVSSSGGGNASFPGPSPREIECLVYGPDTLQERVIMAEVRRCEQLVYKENVNAD